MLSGILPFLRCPYCAAPLEGAGQSLACAAGHTFDLARQGYVSLLGRRACATGDTATMVAARGSFLAEGHYAPLDEAIAELAREAHPGQGLFVEVGAGTGFHLAALLDHHSQRLGLAIDASRFAARRAAKAHPRLGSVVADATVRLPVADACAALALNLFAPRPGSELRRILVPDGVLLVAFPEADHLEGLRAPLGMLQVDPSKEGRVAAALGPAFQKRLARRLRWEMALSRDAAMCLVGMGPSAFHLDPAVLAQTLAAMPEPIRVQGAVRLDLYRAMGPNPLH